MQNVIIENKGFALQYNLEMQSLFSPDTFIGIQMAFEVSQFEGIIDL